MTTSFDIIVVGGGAMGLATARSAAVRGASVLLLEQDGIPGIGGSSAGAERQWRIQYAEKDLAALTLQALPLWRDLENRLQRRLVHHTGSLWFGDITESTNEGQIAAAAAVLDDLAVGYEWLTAAQIEQRFGFAGLPARFEGFHQPEGGALDVRATLWGLTDLAAGAGVTLLPGHRVTRLDADADGVRVHAGDRSFRGGHVVLAAGAYSNELLEPLGVALEVTIFDMPSASFRLRDATADLPTWFVFQPPEGPDGNLFYGLGRNPWAATDLVRVAPDVETHPLADPRARTDARGDDIRRTAEWVRAHMPMLDPEPVGVSTCLIALPSDHERQFYLGPVPGAERVLVHAAGWGFKFVPLFGEVLADLALTGTTGYGVSRFGLQ